MKHVSLLSVLLVLFLPSCRSSQVPVHGIPETPSLTVTQKTETLQVISTFTSLPQSCATPAPSELQDFIKQSITIEDSGKTFVTHVTSRFWIYLDDRIYPLPDLLDAIPTGLIGYVSNGSIRGPQCYPIMFEALEEGKRLLQIKDFQLQIIVDNNAPESSLPLPK